VRIVKRKGIPIVVSAASGTGKTSLCLQLLSTLSNVTRSVSYTTRPPRGEEVSGRDYHFVDDIEFTRMVEAGEFIEWAQVFGHRYGTALRTVEEQIAEGLDVLLDIDVQGGKNMRRVLPQSLLIFLLPPSMPELRRRLVNRATESPDAIERRLAAARAEIRECHIYDFLVVNDDFEKAAADLRAIVTAARLRAERPDDLVRSLLTE
jgi:guanylate kinase